MTMGEVNATALTIVMGRTSRVPKTERRIPHVKSRRCHTSDISERILALTTALSKESVTSSTTRVAARKKAPNPPHHSTAPSATSETVVGRIKSFITLEYYRCPGEDLNLHALRHTHLKRTWLPITPPGHCRIMRQS